MGTYSSGGGGGLLTVCSSKMGANSMGANSRIFVNANLVFSMITRALCHFHESFVV